MANPVAIKGAIFAVCLCVAEATEAQTSDPLVLTPQEMQLTAMGAFQSGNFGRALALSEALLLRDPYDPLALRVGSQSALQIGRSDVALRHARTLYFQSDDPEERHAGARLAALALAQQDRLTQAQIWLRRARQTAPDDQAGLQVARDYQTLRQRNPLAFNFDIGISPSSNINNGSSSDTFEALGLEFLLTPDAQGLSGFEASFSGGVSYRLHESARSLTTLAASAEVVRYRLSSESRDEAPDFDAGVLAFERVALSLSHRWAAQTDDQPVSASLSYGITQLGGDLYATDLNLAVSRRWGIDPATSITAQADLGRTVYKASGNSADSWNAELQWLRRFESGHQLTLSAGVGATLSDEVALRNERRTIGATYNFGSISETFDLSLSVDQSWRNYEPSFLIPDGRSDARTEIAVTVGLPTIEVYGFEPVVRLEAQRTNSNSARFDSETLSMDLSFRSSF